MGRASGLAKEQQRALGRLSALAPLAGFYLAGGSAVGWHLHHRRSNDLDLFSLKAIDLRRVERAIKKLEDVKVVSVSDATLKIEIEGTLVDIVSYPYPPLETPTRGPQGWPVAGRIDLAVMKLAAVARPGIRRDFWDMRVLVESGISIENAARAYVRRFRVSEGDLYPVLRALTYFDDAEKDPAFPDGMTPRAWAATKRFFVKRGGEAMRALLESE